MSWMCKDDSGYSSPLSIKGKSSWEDNPPTESEVERSSQDAKDKATKQLKRALATLDTAVQKWYEVNAPSNKERYATCHIRTYRDGSHVSDLTLLPNSDTFDYVDIASSKDRRKTNGSTHC